MERYEEIEQTITKRYRKEIWKKFIKGISEYEMIKEGDKIAVCMSGGKDSMLMAKCFQELKKHRKMNFEIVFIVMNPGYNQQNKQQIISNSELLNIPIKMFETDIFSRVVNIEDNPCYLCARMRRGYLYEEAKKYGCNKIALGHHFNDVIETILMGIFYGSQVQTMMPKVCSTSHPGMELIRPLYFIKEEDIERWRDKNNLKFIECACKFTEEYTLNNEKEEQSKRQEMKLLIKEMKKQYDNIDINIFNSVQNVNLDTIISYRREDKFYHFLDDYGKGKLDEKSKV